MHPISSHEIQLAKQAAAKTAASLVQSGMLIGLGTGSTATCFIQELIKHSQEDRLAISAVATSKQSMKLAMEGKIPLVDIDSITSIDLTVDGADEIDPQKRMIKGGGGALLREKIVASMSREVIIIVDQQKLVPFLGKFPLPVEIFPFAYQATILHLNELGYTGILRKGSQDQIYLTDNGNYIYDIHLNRVLENPEKDHQRIRKIPGVIEVGLFINLANRVVIGFYDGHVEIRT